MVQGHRVASGLCGDPRFPDGTIAPQLEAFRSAHPALFDRLAAPPHAGTINVRTEGVQVDPVAPAIVRDLAWTPHFPPETFSLSRCTLVHAGTSHAAILYRPDPAIKPAHHQPADQVELIAAFIPGLGYGDAVELRFDPDEVRVHLAA